MDPHDGLISVFAVGPVGGIFPKWKESSWSDRQDDGARGTGVDKPESLKSAKAARESLKMN